jgi:hypothetical protein
MRVGLWQRWGRGTWRPRGSWWGNGGFSLRQRYRLLLVRGISSRIEEKGVQGTSCLLDLEARGISYSLVFRAWRNWERTCRGGSLVWSGRGVKWVRGASCCGGNRRGILPCGMSCVFGVHRGIMTIPDRHQSLRTHQGYSGTLYSCSAMVDIVEIAGSGTSINPSWRIRLSNGWNRGRACRRDYCGRPD